MNEVEGSWSNRELYDQFMGRWSILVAEKFLNWLEIDNTHQNKMWADIGCGTGALTYKIFENMEPKYVIGVDPSQDYLPISNNPKLNFTLGSSINIPIPFGGADYVVSGLAFNFMEDPKTSLVEMISKLRHGGLLSMYVWDYNDKMEFLRYFWDAAIDHNDEAKVLDEGNIFPICSLEKLEKLFLETGLQGIETKNIDITTKFDSFDDYWQPFLGGQGPAGNYVSSLSEEERIILMNLLKSNLPISEDGSFTLTARALAIKGSKEEEQRF